MATLIPLSQTNVSDSDGNAFVITKVRHDGGSSNTFTIPPGASDVECLTGSGETAPTTSVSGTTVTIQNGSAADLYFVSRHVGRNPAGI